LRYITQPTGLTGRIILVGRELLGLNVVDMGLALQVLLPRFTLMTIPSAVAFLLSGDMNKLLTTITVLYQVLSPSVYFNLALSNTLRSAGSNFFDKIAQKNANEKTVAAVVTIIRKSPSVN
jgi:hypothetical protein